MPRCNLHRQPSFQSRDVVPAYSLTWSCGDCKTQNERPLTKVEAAFFGALKVQRTLRCKKCGGGNVTAFAHAGPEVSDPEVLQPWLDNEKLYFLEQDEELMLALVDARRLVDLLNDPATPRARLRLLLRGLVYRVHAGKLADPDEEQAAKDYLKQNLAVWKDTKSIPFQIRKAVLAALREE